MRKQYISDFKNFTNFPNFNSFCTFFLLRNFYSGDAPHANYGKHRLNHHFQHSHTVHMTFTVFRKFSKLLFVLHILAYSKFELRWFWPYQLSWTLFNSSFPTLRTVCIWDLPCFKSFRNFCLFCTFWLIRNFYSGAAHHANYRKQSINHHFQHCAHSVY